MKQQKGFELIELVIVLVIIAILAAIAIPAYIAHMQKAVVNQEAQEEGILVVKQVLCDEDNCALVVPAIDLERIKSTKQIQLISEEEI